MRVVGMLRVRNEARWINKVIGSILPLCERVVVLDDHSDDGTPDICASLPGVEVISSPFDGLNESRDKNLLLEHAVRYAPGWILHIDGDEELEHGGADRIRRMLRYPKAQYYSLPIVYLWDSPRQMRVDGVYERFRRSRLFKPLAGAYFPDSRGAANFHCGNVPAPYGVSGVCPARLLHYGYLHREDRLKKYEWYNASDPDNDREDRYRHIVIGDVFPPESKFKHAGPLKLAPAF